MPKPGQKTTPKPKANFPMDGQSRGNTTNSGYKAPSYPSQNVPSENRGNAGSKAQRPYASKG